MEFAIEFVGSLILFLNKIYLRKKISFGWLLGIAGIILVSIPQFQKGLFITVIYNCGFATLLFYGYLISRNHPFFSTSPKSKFLTRIFLISMTILMCVYLSIETHESKEISAGQLIQAISGLIGVLLLAFNLRKTNIIGWYLYIISHAACIYCAQEKSLWAIEFFQALSIIVAIDSIKREIKNRPSVT